MKLLAIDTSTEACSASLFVDGVYFNEFQVAPREHTKLIFPMMDSLLAQANIRLNDVDAFAFGRGPGSFTGVRLATSLIQGMAFAMDKPVIAISTLQAMAQGGIRQSSASHIFVAIDARMQEVYCCSYARDANNIAAAMSEEEVCHPQKINVPHQKNWIAVGSGWGSYGDVLKKHFADGNIEILSDFYPNARDIAYLAQIAYDKGLTISAELAIPIYLRDKVTN